MNQRAEVSGKVLDPTGAVVPGATITLRQISTANTRTTHAAADGRFNLAALPPGSYRVEVSSPGFFDLSEQLHTEGARPRAPQRHAVHWQRKLRPSWWKRRRPQWRWEWRGA